MVGDEASQLRSMLEVNYPMENGIVRSWEDMKHVWNYTFKERLGVDPRSTKVSLQRTGTKFRFTTPTIHLVPWGVSKTWKRNDGMERNCTLWLTNFSVAYGVPMSLCIPGPYEGR